MNPKSWEESLRRKQGERKKAGARKAPTLSILPKPASPTVGHMVNRKCNKETKTEHHEKTNRGSLISAFPGPIL